MASPCPFHKLPYEIIARLVVEASSDLSALLQTSRAINTAILGTAAEPNHDVLAQICRRRFDTAAPQRRLGTLLNQDLADELRKRCPALRRIATAVVYGDHVVADLWLVFLMLTEHDTKNIPELDRVRVHDWVKTIIFVRLNEHIDHNGWPVESELVQLAAAVFAIVDTRAAAAAEPDHDRDALLALFRPFMFGAHRYPIAHLPTTQHVVSAHHRLPPPHTHTFVTMASAPVHAPARLPAPHFGRRLTLARPLAAAGAILATYLRNDLVDAHVDPRLPATRAHADALGWRHGAVQADYAEANRVRREGLGVATRGAASARWDPDFWRLALVHRALEADPLVDRHIAACWFGSIWTPGMFSGKWVGRHLIPSYRWYTHMLAMHPSSLSLVEATLSAHELEEPVLPIQFTLREHICTAFDRHVGHGAAATGDGVQNGWFPDALDPSASRGGMQERDGELVIDDPLEPDRAFAVKRYKTWFPGMELPAASPPPAFPRVGAPAPDADAAPEDVEMAAGSDADADEDEDEDEGMDDDEDEDEDEEEDPPGVDVIITGETDHAHGAAWGACKVYGRVRRNDGLVVLVRVPENSLFGRWIFRGYVRAGRSLVGRWRETGTSMDVAGYEGSFVLGKVDDTW